MEVKSKSKSNYKENGFYPITLKRHLPGNWMRKSGSKSNQQVNICFIFRLVKTKSAKIFRYHIFKSRLGGFRTYFMVDLRTNIV